MEKVKVIVRRPINHYLIIAIYILAPVGNILMIRIAGAVPFEDIFKNFFYGFGLFAGLWLLTAPLIGIGFYFVNRVTWYAFILHSSLIIIDYVYKWASRPVYYMKTISAPHNSLMFLGNLTLIVIVGYVIQKNFRAPYFQALQRNWRESARIPIHHVIQVNSQQMEIDDLSTGGCFVLKSDTPLSISSIHDIAFDSDKLHISCKGQVMRQTESGYGIMFKDLGKQQKQDIHYFLKKRFSLRHEIIMKGEWQQDNANKLVTLLDFSKGGCFIQSDVQNLKIHDSGIVSFDLDGHRYGIHATVTWINHRGEHKKPEGFGCSFRLNHKGLVKRVVEENGTSNLIR